MMQGARTAATGPHRLEGPSGVRGASSAPRAAELAREEAELRARLHELERLLAVLQALPQRLWHGSMLPIGAAGLAFQPGRVERTNEVLVDLGGGLLAWQTSYAAQRILIRRMNALAQGIEARRAALHALQAHGPAGDAQEPAAAAPPPAPPRPRAEHPHVHFGPSFTSQGEFRLSMQEVAEFEASLPRKQPSGPVRIAQDQHDAVMRRLAALADEEAREAEAEGRRTGKVGDGVDDGLGDGDSSVVNDDTDDDDADDDDVDDDVDELARSALSLDDDELDDYGSDDEPSKFGVGGAEALAAPALPLKGILKKSALPLAAPSAAGAAAAAVALPGSAPAAPVHKILQVPPVLGKVIERDAAAGAAAPPGAPALAQGKRVSLFKQNMATKATNTSR
jgi:prefoldin subunit 5